MEDEVWMNDGEQRLPVRLTDEGRTATWNPALTRAPHVLLHVRRVDGGTEVRRSSNSGRARVRADERICAVTTVEVEG